MLTLKSSNAMALNTAVSGPASFMIWDSCNNHVRTLAKSLLLNNICTILRDSEYGFVVLTNLLRGNFMNLNILKFGNLFLLLIKHLFITLSGTYKVTLDELRSGEIQNWFEDKEGKAVDPYTIVLWWPTVIADSAGFKIPAVSTSGRIQLLGDLGL
ncbi:hypothetical protein Tco_0569703 [Tanacetum coccineum]